MILSDSPVTEEYFVTVSDTEDENDWKKRGILGVAVADHPDELFFSVHYGWWGDADEPFARQWTKTVGFLAPLQKNRRVWLMGDFTSLSASTSPWTRISTPVLHLSSCVTASFKRFPVVLEYLPVVHHLRLSAST